jgi:hypothetical protein
MKQVEVEGGELALKNSFGDIVIIPKKNRLEVEGMIKDKCWDCVDAFVDTLPVMEDYAEDGSLFPDWDKVKTKLNPKNWGVTDYTDKFPDKDKAFTAARKAGEKEYLYKGVRYTTDYAGTPQQQLKETGITDNQLYKTNAFQERLYNNLVPVGYTNMESRVWDAVVKNEKDKQKDIPNNVSKERQDAYNFYMGKPQKNNTFNVSKYTPSTSKEKNTVYYSLNNENFLNDILDQVDNKGNFLDYSQITSSNQPVYGNPDIKKKVMGSYENVMGNFTLSKGNDDKGNYISYYDKWDIAPLDFGKPFEIYDRIYVKDYGDGKQKRMYYSDKELSELDVNKKNFDTLALQKELANRGVKFEKSVKKDGSFDGIWGEETKAALLDYQTKNKKK